MSKTKIEWADSVLNCISGCTRVSAGCANCYAIPQSYRCAAMGIDKYDGVTEKKDKVLDWTGTIKMHPEVLKEPDKRRTPTRYFVNSMSDTFHPDVPFDFIDRIFQMCLNNPCHEFMILTKRPENIINYLESGITRIELLAQTRNVILMTTIENRNVAYQRLNALAIIKLTVPGIATGLSCEPLLDWIEFTTLATTGYYIFEKFSLLNWVIVGGESGHNARPMHPDWARTIRDQCIKANVPFFFKQWGEFCPPDQMSEEVYRYWYAFRCKETYDGIKKEPAKIGKKKAGRVLDGRTWDGLPDLMRDRK